MKLKLSYLILLLCLCCNETSKKESIAISIGDISTKDSSNVVEELLKDLDEKLETGKAIEECIFDQATQTDEFSPTIQNSRRCQQSI